MNEAYAGENDAGKRIDVFLTEHAENNKTDEYNKETKITRTTVQRLLSEGQVFCNGKKIKKNYRIINGDVITYHIPIPIAMEASPENIPLDIIYEDAYLLVVNKPRGLVVHPAAGHPTGTLVNALLHHCNFLSGIGGVLRPGIVHRLDKDTSGLMVIAKTDFAHANLAEQLANRTMGRIYNAICLGKVKDNIALPLNKGVSNRSVGVVPMGISPSEFANASRNCYIKIDLPIGRHPIDRKKMAVILAPQKGLEQGFFEGSKVGGKARNAITHIEVKEYLKINPPVSKGVNSQYTFIVAKLETGRTHQIRVHMSYIGHPILGDTVYGSAQQPFGLNGQILHAKEIHFIHPSLGIEMSFSSDLPAYFQEVLGLLEPQCFYQYS